MVNRKRNQHYVYKDYLKSWYYDKSSLWCARLINEQYKIFSSNGDSVAVERDFYKVKPMNSHETLYVIRLVKKLFQEFSLADADIIKEINYQIRPTIVRKDLESYNEMLKERIPDKIEEIDQKFSEIYSEALTAEINWLEDRHCIIENSGADYISKLKNKNLDFYSMNLDCPQPLGKCFEDENFKFLHFMSVQALRTKKQRDAFKDIFENTSCQFSVNIQEINIDNIQDVFTYFQQLKLALDLRLGNVNVTIVENKTELPFITSDQPVVVKENFSTEANEKQQLPQLYYPISPTVAILINYANLETKVIISEKNKIDVCNKLIFDFSHEMIFSNDKEILEKLIQEK